MTIDLLTAARLEPGQSLRMAIDAGASLMVVQGRVRIVSPPSWLGEAPFSASHGFDEGEVYVAGRAGWIEIEALTAARVRSVPQAVPAAPVLRTRVARLVQLLFAG